ncbi:MAG: hypothetical protein IJD42_05425 [Clostridia bacterium]|nr:hypothetical protein [Clostridia bacterium]
MKRRYFIIAVIFLFNPIVSVFDIFPDFIGYLLLMKAFSNASYVYDKADETKYAFRTMAIVSIFKIVSLIILPFTDATMALVFSFSFAIIEIIFGFGAYQKLFDTISFICLRCGEEQAVGKSERLKKFTAFFFVVRVVSSTIPDLFALFLSDPQKAWMYRFRIIFFILFVTIATIVGLIWLARCVHFFKHSLTDELKARIDADFNEEMKDRQSVFFSKDFIFAISVILVSMIFTIDFYIDEIEMLSDILLAPIFLCGFLFLVKKGYIVLKKVEKLLILSLVVHFASSILNTIFLARFNKEYHTINLISNENAQRLFLPVQIFNTIEALSIVAIVLLCTHLLKAYSIQKIYENPKFFAEYSVDNFVKEYTGNLSRKIKALWVFTIISAVCAIIYPFAIPYFEAFVVVDILSSLIFYMVLTFTFSYISDEIFKKILKYS